MSSNWKRLTYAALMSGLCFLATKLWFELTEKASEDDGSQSIASVSSAGDDVLRKKSQNLVWLPVFKGDKLFNGETIRTSSRSNAQIKFDDSDRYIDIEPDTMIRIEKTQGEIALDLVEGSLFVNSKSENDGSKKMGLVLNSKEGKVDLSEASASLSKSANQDGVDMDVVEGKAMVKGKSGTKEITKGTSGNLSSSGDMQKKTLQIMEPLGPKPIFTDPVNDPGISFMWSGAEPAWNVTFMEGPSPKELTDKAVDTNHTGLVAVRLSKGRHFWKLRAKDTTGRIVADTPVQKLQVYNRFAPTVVFPTADQKLTMETFPQDLQFKWQKGEMTNKILLEVAEDPLMYKKVASKGFTDEESYTLPNLNQGTYYWRMSAYYVGSEKPTSGKIYKFSLFRPEKIPPKDPVNIVWNITQENLKQYFVQKPQIHFGWTAKNRKEDVTGWKLSLKEEKDAATDTLSRVVNATEFNEFVQKPGRYIASVEAYDKDQNIIGQSTPLSIDVAPMPLLAAPSLQTDADKVISAGEDGRAMIRWGDIKGAKEYEISVSNTQGKVLLTQKTNKNFSAVKGLMPGEYSVSVKVRDQYDRLGGENPPSTIRVPAQSNLKAPSIKNIKIKTTE